VERFSVKTKNHKQCLLRQCENTYMVSWIPSHLARVGRTVKLQDDEGNWSEGWTVVEVYQTCPTNEAVERSRDWKHQRKASDI
jgi:hypothetical protein